MTPGRIKKPCAWAGCREILSGGERYCQAHRRENYRQDDVKRSGEKAIYKTARWQRLREFHLNREPLCRLCKMSGRPVPGRVVDHIRRIKAGGDPFDPANLQTLCDRCHNVKRSEEARE
jgi:5-methylcytosine-specific restriction protein A